MDETRRYAGGDRSAESAWRERFDMALVMLSVLILILGLVGFLLNVSPMRWKVISCTGVLSKDD
ncbi:hypothetical protein [Rhizobium sp. 007]|uniref:hypothetical protein n=1 Tax=Rhizobium sp. 007 TaxID=2785056 RepID=UPI0018901D67|nr:hypothetical protein [Rhizobium sp. 007]QPB24678.1 hypothetical protein ISN39_34865 [Rhizobium sp. 007]